jgi:universal stress protein F
VLKRLESVAPDAADVQSKVITGKPGVEIARYAGTNKIDLIIVGSQAPGAVDYALGSTASRVVRKSPCSVLIVR